MKIAIIGMGAAGISVLGQWTKYQQLDPSIELTVYGNKETFGTGLPYGKDTDEILLNQVAEKMSVDADHPADFLHWLHEKGVEHPEGYFAPRVLYGNYLKERSEGWLEKSNPAVLKEDVSSVRLLDEDCFEVHSPSGVRVFDVIHLCAGHTEFSDPYHFEGNNRFFSFPFPIEKKIQQLPLGAKVGVLGTGLTSVDVLRYQRKHRQDLTLSFYSLDGAFKTIAGPPKKIIYTFFTKENLQKEKEKHGGFIPLSVYKEWLIKEGECSGIDVPALWKKSDIGKLDSLQKELENPREFSVLQAIIGQMDPILPDLWLALTEEDKQEFLNSYYNTWEKMRGAFPLSTGQQIVEDWQSGKIKVYGKVHDIQPIPKGFRITEGELDTAETHDIDYLINATGPRKNFTADSVHSPLLRQLLNERLLQPEPFGGVLVTWPGGSAVSQRYGVLERLKVHGSWISGIQFGNNAVTVIADGAKQAVESIVNKNTGNPRETLFSR